MRICGDEMCNFRYEENNLGNFFREVKDEPEIAHFLIETAWMAFNSLGAQNLAEPFPSFLLKSREVGRPKEGNLAFIAQAQEKGIDVRKAEKTLN